MDAREQRILPLRGLYVLAVLGLCAASAALFAEEGGDAGAWQTHQLTFNYLGDVTTGTTYSCNGLNDDLTFLLEQSGARLNQPIRTVPCVGGAGTPSTMLTVKLDFSTFSPDSAAASAPPGPSLPGSWRQVVFSEPHSYPSLRSSDCELVREFRDKILPLFVTRNVKANLTCLPFQAENALYGLSFEAFVPSDTPRRAVGGTD